MSNVITPPAQPEELTLPRECRVATTLREFDLLEADWNRLWLLNSKREIFQHFGWVRAWMRSYGAKYRSFIVIVRDRDNVTGIIPLVLAGRTLKFAAYSVSDYNLILCDPVCTAEVLKRGLAFLNARKDAWDTLELDNIPVSSSFYQSLRDLPGLAVVTSVPCPTILLDQEREKLLNEILAKDSLKRHSKKLARVGPLSFRHVESVREFDEHLDGFFKQHVRRAAIAGRQSPLEGAASASFFRSLAGEMDLRGPLRFSVLEAGGKPVAYHLGFQLDGKYVWYKPSFDVDYWGYSPGEVLLHKLFQYVKEQDIREFDFTQGSEEFKYRFANHVNKNVTLRIYPAGTISAWRRCFFRASRDMRKFARKFLTFCESLGRRALDATRPLTSRVKARRRLETVYAAAESIHNAADQGRFYSLSTPTLGDLADISSQYPALVDHPRLTISRDRFKRGHITSAAWDQGKAVAIAWARELRQPVPRGQVTPDAPPALLVYDLWAPANSDAVLRILADVREKRPGFEVFVSRRCLPRRIRALFTMTRRIESEERVSRS